MNTGIPGRYGSKPYRPLSIVFHSFSLT
jgi:hypothetical protein